MEPTPGQTKPISCTEARPPSVSGLSRVQQAILNVVLTSEAFLSFKDIGAALQIDEHTVARAMRDEKYVHAYQYFCIQASGHKFGQVMDSLSNLAAAGSAPHQKMYLQIHKVLHDKSHDAPPVRPEDDDMAVLRRRQREIEKELKGGAVDASFTEEPDA